jgi:FkbM family methyltransferase
MNSLSLFLKYARYRYIIHRLLLRIKMGKEKRNEYLQKTMLSIIDFLPERPYFMNGIRAIPRRHTNDFYMLFTPREELLKPHLIMNENETFVDVGANVGSYSLKVATDNKDKSVNIVAIEAHPENYKALCRNIACNGFTNIAAINKAVSDKKDIISLYQHITNTNRVMTDDPSICIQYEAKVSSLQVESDNLDNILKENNVQTVDVLKMDIEGAEVLALKAATNTLNQLRKIIVEIHGENLEAIKTILQDNGFSVKKIVCADMYYFDYIIGDKIGKNEIISSGCSNSQKR